MSGDNPETRTLPDQPSLEHLRKESKRLLQQLRGRARSARLADAQLLLARAYGCSSWRMLKQKVEHRLSLPAPAAALGHHRVVQQARWDDATAESLLYQCLTIGMAFCQLAAAIAGNPGA